MKGVMSLHASTLLDARAGKQGTAADGYRSWVLFCFLAVLEFELRASHLLGRHSTT
jgi:hypothetical protein